VNPLIGFALAHAEEASLDHLQGVGFDVGQNKKEPIFGCRQGAVAIDGKLAGRPGFAIEPPYGHMRLEGRLKGRDQLLKLVEVQAGEIQELRRARLHIGKLYTGHAWCLLLWEAQYTINRDNLNLSPVCQEDAFYHSLLECRLVELTGAYTCFQPEVRAGWLHGPPSIHLWSDR
jgi:hypothetical protein